MRVEEAKKEIPDMEAMNKYLCGDCISKSIGRCTGICDRLDKARKIGYERLIACYARHNGYHKMVCNYIRVANI